MNPSIKPADKAATWWWERQPYHGSTSNPRADRAGLSRLRRATVIGAMCEPATFDLLRVVAGTQRELPEVALCAAVLAAIRSDAKSGMHPARALGPRPGEKESSAVMSPLRFRRLVEADTIEDRLLMFRRAVALLKGTANVRRMAGACLDWSDAVRRDWIFQYYNAASAAPSIGTDEVASMGDDA